MSPKNFELQKLQAQANCFKQISVDNDIVSTADEEMCPRTQCDRVLNNQRPASLCQYPDAFVHPISNINNWEDTVK